jgi:hypothetical protein
MTESSSTGPENTNLYARGGTEGLAGKPLEGNALLEVLDVFGEDGLRAYIVGHIEGTEGAQE